MAVQAQFITGFQDSLGFDVDSFAFDFQQSHHQNVYFLQQIAPFEHCNRGTQASSSSTSSSSLSNLDSFLPQFFDSQHLEMQRQNQELDCFLQSQTEKLKCGLQELTRQHMGYLVRKVESEAMYLMKQKEEDLTQARNKSMALESCIRKTQKEIECLQVMAKQNEAMAINLSKKIEQLSTENIPDSESGSNWQRNEEEEAERAKKIVCKGCNYRASSLILLPCRHLCSCKTCEAFFISCPVCQSFKEGSIEVLWV
ncbi:probable BOI-related E3 ubiquitin-protein ligase 2 [Euphorbia lathyris]|uniref:probable BOI-related E3 ubiquitin-protein ligase 2 n=1 Tax=Euphorbia lathyris TaxID=212925 RepID=UPI003313761A